MSGHRIEYVEPVRQRRPRVKDGGHLDNIRQLPCIICGTHPVEAAHVRIGSRKHGKRPTGLGEKPDDRWTIPLCARHHRLDPEAQHSGYELRFWDDYEIDPFATALSLWAADGDLTTMEQIIREARR